MYVYYVFVYSFSIFLFFVKTNQQLRPIVYIPVYLTVDKMTTSDPSLPQPKYHTIHL